MRVSLIHPRLIYEPSQPPLGLGYIAAVLEKDGNDVQFIEGAFYETDQDIADALKEFSPDLIGVSVMVSYHTKSLLLADCIKLNLPDIPVVFGGPHPSVLVEEFVSKACVDYVIAGEAEESMRLLAEGLSEPATFDPTEVPGLHWGGGSAKNPMAVPCSDLDTLPWPARHLMPMQRYRHQNNTVSLGMHGTNFNVMTARGCPYTCNFCDHTVFGYKIRYRDLDDVVDEIEEVSTRYNIVNFDVMDDTFTTSRRRVTEFCEKLIERDLKLFWSCRLRVNTVTRELLEVMSRSGCIRFSLGIETVDDIVLANIEKKITVDKVLQVLKWAKDFNMLTIGNFMIGNLGDSKTSVRKTIKFAVETETIDIPSFVVLTPLPGTPVFDIGKENGWIRTYDWDEYTMNTKGMPIMRNEVLTHQDIKELYSEAAAAVAPRIKDTFRKLHDPRVKYYDDVHLDGVM